MTELPQPNPIAAPSPGRRQRARWLIAAAVAAVVAVVVIVAVVLTRSNDDPRAASCTTVTSEVGAAFAGVVRFTVDGAAAVPANVPKPGGTQVGACSITTTSSRPPTKSVVGRYSATTAREYGAALIAAGYQAGKPETVNGRTVTQYDRTPSKAAGAVVLIEAGATLTVVWDVTPAR